MPIQHVYTQTVADGTATSVVRPSDWNSSHNMVLNMSGNTAGTSRISGTDIIWAGGSNITLSANGSTVSVIGASQTVQTQNLQYVTLGGNTSGTLAAVSSGTLTLAGGNNIVLSQSGNAITISGSNQTTQTQAAGNIAGTGYTSTTQAGTTVGLTHNTAGLSVAWPPFITAGGGGGGSLNVSAGTTSNNLTNLVFSNNGNVQFGLSGSTISANAALVLPAMTWSSTAPYLPPQAASVATSLVQGAFYFNYINFPYAFFQVREVIPFSFSPVATSSVTFSGSISGLGTQLGTYTAAGSIGHSFTGSYWLRDYVAPSATQLLYAAYSSTMSLGAGYTASVSWSTNAGNATVRISTTGAISYINSIDQFGGVSTTVSSTSSTTQFNSNSTNANTFSSNINLTFVNNLMSGLKALNNPFLINWQGGEAWYALRYSSQSGSTNIRLDRPLLNTGNAIFYTAPNSTYADLGFATANSVSNWWAAGVGSVPTSITTNYVNPTSGGYVDINLSDIYSNTNTNILYGTLSFMLQGNPLPNT